MQWVREYKADIEENANALKAAYDGHVSKKLEHDASAMNTMIKHTFINNMTTTT